jgi:hypothetical protein
MGGSFNIPWQIYDFLFQVGRRGPVAFPKINIVLLRFPLNLPLASARGREDSLPYAFLASRALCGIREGRLSTMLYLLTEIGVNEIL